MQQKDVKKPFAKSDDLKLTTNDICPLISDLLPVW